MSPEVLQYANPTDDDATRVSGNQLTAPKSGQNLSTREYTYDNGHKTTFSKWESLCTVDDFVPKLEQDDDGLAHESCRIQLRISDQVKQLDAGRVESDFNHFWWALAKFSDDQLDEWSKKGKSSNATAEEKLKGGYKKKMVQMSFACRSLAGFCRAMGYQDRLANRSVFRGLSRIKDVIPHFSGKQLIVVFEKGEDRNGEMRVNIRGFKKA